MNFNSVKLIIWDMDETFWSGVLSEGNARFLPSRLKLVKDITLAGVVNSVCSKNDKEKTEDFLRENGALEYFVFNSVNWSPKGERINQIITEMNLRPVNVLFIDDNPINLREAEKYSEGIMTATPDIIPELEAYFSQIDKKDVSHKRLNQYKLLEQKKQFRAQMGSNEDFLYSCDIRVDIKTDCINYLDRISELVLRSNQLNFTKQRSSRQTLSELFENKEVTSGNVCNTEFPELYAEYVSRFSYRLCSCSRRYRSAHGL